MNGVDPHSCLIFFMCKQNPRSLPSYQLKRILIIWGRLILFDNMCSLYFSKWEYAAIFFIILRLFNNQYALFKINFEPPFNMVFRKHILLSLLFFEVALDWILGENRFSKLILPPFVQVLVSYHQKFVGTESLTDLFSLFSQLLLSSLLYRFIFSYFNFIHICLYFQKKGVLGFWGSFLQTIIGHLTQSSSWFLS